MNSGADLPEMMEYDAQFPELGPGYWNTASLLDNRDENSNSNNNNNNDDENENENNENAKSERDSFHITAENGNGKISHTMKRAMKRQVASLKKRSKAMPSFV